MVEQNENKIRKIRTIKNYHEAHNHILVRKVLQITDSYVRLHCRSYHFGRVICGPKDVQIGNLMVRVVPYRRAAQPPDVCCGYGCACGYATRALLLHPGLKMK